MAHAQARLFVSIAGWSFIFSRGGFDYCIGCFIQSPVKIPLLKIFNQFMINNGSCDHIWYGPLEPVPGGDIYIPVAITSTRRYKNNDSIIKLAATNPPFSSQLGRIRIGVITVQFLNYNNSYLCRGTIIVGYQFILDGMLLLRC